MKPTKRTRKPKPQAPWNSTLPVLTIRPVKPTSREIIEATYAKHKQVWNNRAEFAAPRLVVDTIIAALQEAGL